MTNNSYLLTEFVQDVASRGLGLVYTLSDSNSQTDLANSLLDQLIGGKRQVNQVTGDTELFAEGMLGKTPTGGNITTYKELCSLASDLNQPDMIYQFMQLANHNATWTSKLGAAFGLKTLSAESRQKMQPYLGKIIPRLYRYKYDPTPKIQNSMISIWDTIVNDSKEVTEQYYWEILRELLDNLTCTEWRVRIACCLAVRDLLKRSNGLRLRSEEKLSSSSAAASGTPRRVTPDTMDVDELPEPELRELWYQLFRVMDDIHEGTRMTAQGTASFLGKLCVLAASAEHGKTGTAVATSILPYLLETGVGHKVADIRKVSIKTISEMIDSSGAMIAPHLATLIPCMLRATGELENTKLSYVSTRLGGDNEAQEAVDSLRAEAAKSHHTMETISKCVRFIDYPVLERMTPELLELMKSSVNLGTKIGCAHFVCLVREEDTKSPISTQLVNNINCPHPHPFGIQKLMLLLTFIVTGQHTSGQRDDAASGQIFERLSWRHQGSQCHSAQIQCECHWTSDGIGQGKRAAQLMPCSELKPYQKMLHRNNQLRIFLPNWTSCIWSSRIIAPLH